MAQLRKLEKEIGTARCKQLLGKTKRKTKVRRGIRTADKLSAVEIEGG